MSSVLVRIGRLSYPTAVPRKSDVAKYAAEFARLGGKARAKKLSAEERRASARKAARARWAKAKGAMP